MRWWDGATWTDETGPVALLSSVPARPSTFGDAPRDTGTSAGWLLAISPVAGFGFRFALWFVIGYLVPTIDPDSLALAVVDVAIGLAIFWSLAVWDQHQLRRAGYHPPRIWWMLLLPPIGYFAGRGRALRAQGVKPWPIEVTAAVCTGAIWIASRMLGG